MMNATQVKKGKIIVIDGELHVVLGTVHLTPGNKRGMIQVEAKSLASGTKINKRFRSTDKVEDAFIETRTLEYSYDEGNHFVFMDTDTWEELRFESAAIQDEMKFLKHNTRVKVNFHVDIPVGIELPTTVELTVT
jgi:elongation factor P